MIRAIVSLPYWIAQLATGAKSFRDNPLIGSRRLNRLGLHAARVRLAAAMARRRRSSLAPGIAPEHRAEFERDGFVRIENFLPADEFAALRDQLFATAAPAREQAQGDAITRRIAVDSALLRALPQLRALLMSPRWRGLMRYVASFGSEPLYYIQTIFARRLNAQPDPQTWLHADTFHATMKAWLFLTPVAEEDGPFCYVPGSHRLTPARLAWERERSLRAATGLDFLSSRGSMRVDPAELPALGLPPPVRLAVPANTLVVADTFGFHARGIAARPSRRIEIWAYARRNPFLPWTGLDPLSAPGLAERRVMLLWSIRDTLAKFIGQPWQNVGKKTPTDN